MGAWWREGNVESNVHSDDLKVEEFLAIPLFVGYDLNYGLSSVELSTSFLVYTRKWSFCADGAKARVLPATLSHATDYTLSIIIHRFFMKMLRLAFQRSNGSCDCACSSSPWAEDKGV